MVPIEERIEVVKRELVEVKKQRSLDKVEHQNSLLKLWEEYHEKIYKLHSFMDSLSRKKKQQQGDMKQYRETITKVFSEEYLPAYCVAKQAFLLRAVHTTLFLLSKQCAEALKDFDRVVHGMQEDTARVSKDLLSKLMLIERHIHQCEQGMAEAASRIELLSKTRFHTSSSEDEVLDDVPLGDDSLDRSSTEVVTSPKRNTPKRDIPSDRTLDTVSLSYAETSSVDGEQRDVYELSPQRQMQSIPQFVDQPSRMNSSTGIP